MVGDTSDYVRLLALVKKKVCLLHSCLDSTVAELIHNKNRNLLESLHLSSSLAQIAVLVTTVLIWTTIPRYVAVMYVCLFFAVLSLYKNSDVSV